MRLQYDLLVAQVDYFNRELAGVVAERFAAQLEIAERDPAEERDELLLGEFARVAFAGTLHMGHVEQGNEFQQSIEEHAGQPVAVVDNKTLRMRCGILTGAVSANFDVVKEGRDDEVTQLTATGSVVVAKPFDIETDAEKALIVYRSTELTDTIPVLAYRVDKYAHLKSGGEVALFNQILGRDSAALGLGEIKSHHAFRRACDTIKRISSEK